MYLCFYLLLCSRHHVTFTIKTETTILTLRLHFFVHQNVFLHRFLTTEQCCRSGMFISDPNFFHPGSRVKRFPRSAFTSKNLLISTLRIVFELSEILSGMIISDTDFDSLPILDPGSRIQWVKKAPDPDPQHCYATEITGNHCFRQDG